jgi:hypothetical protein
MITLIHGDDNLSSRKYYLSLKKSDAITFDAETLNPIELAQSLQGSGLFEDSKKIFIENLFTRKGSKNLTSVAEILENNDHAEIYIWADKDVGVRSLGKFPKFENQNFKIPQNIWSFLDSIRPNNSRNITSFHNALKGTEPEIVFAMILRQFRLLAGISSDSKQNAEEIKKLAPWQKVKLEKQASLFSQEKIKSIYKKLYKIEKGQKTGSSNLNLVQNIDIMLLEI